MGVLKTPKQKRNGLRDSCLNDDDQAELIHAPEFRKQEDMHESDQHRDHNHQEYLGLRFFSFVPSGYHLQNIRVHQNVMDGDK